MARVLLTGFCAVPGPRRAGVQLKHVIRSLTPLHSVDLLVLREGEQPYVERQGSVRVLRVPTQEADLRAQIQSFQRALKRQLEGADYEIVHCRDGWSGLPVLEARARFGYAVVYDLTRSPLGEPTLDPELDAQYSRDEAACLLAADLVLAPTPAAVKELQRRGRSERVVLSPPGVDVDRFDWDEVRASTPPRIVYVGSSLPTGGVRVLLHAMSTIVHETDVRLVLAGSISPRFETALLGTIRELGLDDKVEVLGPIEHEQLPALLATATVCVVPEAADLTPNPIALYPTKLLEYMACRCPIVVPRRETIRQIVESDREALFFAPGDPLDLARPVLRLLGDPFLRAQLAHNAYERVRRDFTASAARRALRSAYLGLTAQFAGLIAAEDSEDAPKVELLGDDEFEATVFEEPPNAHPVDTLSKLSALEAGGDDDRTGGLSYETMAVATSQLERDETSERARAKPGTRDSGIWTSPVAPSPQGHEDWVVTSVSAAVHRPTGRARGVHSSVVRAESDNGESMTADDGTLIEGIGPVSASRAAGSFVAGEIDVPTAEPIEPPGMDFTAASSRLGGAEAMDVDTGSRTPPVERR